MIPNSNLKKIFMNFFTIAYFRAPVRSKPNTNRHIKKIRRSAFTTLIVMTAFTICYFFYWSLGVDFLVKYVKYYYYLEVTHVSTAPVSLQF